MGLDSDPNGPWLPFLDQGRPSRIERARDTTCLFDSSFSAVPPPSSGRKVKNHKKASKRGAHGERRRSRSNQNDQHSFNLDSRVGVSLRSLSLGLGETNKPNQPSQPNQLSQSFEFNQIVTTSSSTMVKDRHNGSGRQDPAADLQTAQDCVSDVVKSKHPTDQLSLVLQDSIEPIDCRTPNDIQEWPTGDPEHVARTDDLWNRGESTEYDTQADSSDPSDITEEDELSETHPFRLHVRTICKAGLVEFLGLATTAGDSDKRNAQSGPSFTPSGEGPGTQGRSGNSRKRPLSRDANSREDQDDQPNGKNPKLQQANEDDGPTLACPFYKLNPVKHSNCLHFRLKRIKDVKQHLQRKHKQPHYCPICGHQFEIQASLQAHIRARSCEDVIYTVPEGLSEEQTTRLGDRVSRTHTVTNQWYTIWDIVFPDTQRPASPFVEGPIHEVLSSFREFWDERGQELISEHLQRTTEISYSLSREERDLNAFHALVLHESMGELINRFMDRFADPSTSSPLQGVPTPASNEVTGLQSDDNLDLPIRPDSGNVHSFAAARSLAVPHLVTDSGSDPTTQFSRVARALQTNTNAIVDANATQQVSGSRPEDFGNLDDSRWMDEWIEGQENNGDTSDPIGNDVPLDFDFEAFLKGGDGKTSEFDVPADFTFR